MPGGAGRPYAAGLESKPVVGRRRSRCSGRTRCVPRVVGIFASVIYPGSQHARPQLRCQR